MFEHKNMYPVILVPGVIGYGEQTKLHKYVPYFGMTATSYQKVVEEMGVECHTVSFDFLSGTWDRACELFAQLVGGTVDYGKAHSEKYGHARYGKTYTEPMVRNWDKITLVAHGFGAPVARLFIELLNNGSKEERDVTPENELSYLFRGGLYNKVHALVTIAGVNDGISTFEAIETKFPGTEKKLVKAATIVESYMKYGKNVDTYYQMKGLPVSEHNITTFADFSDGKKKYKFNDAQLDAYLKNEDNVFYDIGPWGMGVLNSRTNTYNDVYYFSFSGEVTKNFFNKVTVPKLSAGITIPTAVLISTFENYFEDKPIVTDRDFDNDGLINTNASLAPISEEATAFKDASRCQPGVWYQMPIENRNHLSFMGLGVRPDKYRNEIFSLVKMICNLD